MNTLLKKKLLEFLTESEVEKVLTVIEGLCPECLDAPVGCQCWNDE